MLPGCSNCGTRVMFNSALTEISPGFRLCGTCRTVWFRKPSVQKIVDDLPNTDFDQELRGLLP